MLILHSRIPNKTYSGLQSFSDMNFVPYNLAVSGQEMRLSHVQYSKIKSLHLLLQASPETIQRERRSVAVTSDCAVFTTVCLLSTLVIKLKGHVSSMRSSTTLKQTNWRHIFARLMQDQKFLQPLVIKSIKHVYQTDLWCLKQNHCLTPAIIKELDEEK